MTTLARMVRSVDADMCKTAALMGFALFAVVAIERDSLFGASPSHGRHLASADAYAGASATLSELWDKDGGPVKLIVAASLVLVLGSLAAGAGVGGGGLFVPIYWLILGAGPKGAVPLSKATILGGAVGNFLSLGWSRHPKAERPLIDYEASAFMQSGELLGVVFGVLLNKLLPAICIILFLIAILGWNAFRTLKKARALREKETKAFAKAAAAKEPPASVVSAAPTQDGDVEATPPSPKGEAAKLEEVKVKVEGAKPGLAGVVAHGSHISLANLEDDKPAGVAPAAEAAGAPDVTEAGGSSPSSSDANKEELAAILAAEAVQFPRWAWALLMCMLAYMMAYSFIAKAIQRADGCQQWAYWLWYITPVPVLGGFMYATAVILQRKHKRKEAAGYQYLPADLQWTAETLKKFPITAVVAGVTAGLLGIGGGMVIGPLFLSIGMEPQVGTSSCAFMILWTAFSGVVAYGADDKLGAQLACCCVGIGFVSGQLGQRGVNAVLKKTGRPSYVVFLLGGIIASATLAMSAGMILKMIQGDYNADDKVEDGEALFYLGTGFGCKN